ncbi:MAG: DNA mismatch repair protein MutS [Planctomycetota bacterium]|jgi:DNA mismatch repair protein MutS
MPSTPSSASKGSPKKAKVTMMDQFHRAKKDAPDALLFFRMGDFYELFGDDAKVASRELGIALTARDKGKNPLPMAGVPVRSMEGYLLRLVSKGHKVAICEQMADPKGIKGIVPREIVRVVTAGTITEENALDARTNNYLACLHIAKSSVGLAWIDVSTGRCQVNEVALENAMDELGRIDPAELLLSEDAVEREPALAEEILAAFGKRISEREAWRFERDACRRALNKQFKVATLEGFGVEEDSAVVPAAGALIEYVQDTQRSACEHVNRIERVDSSKYLVLDRATRSCLELTQTQREGRREGTLLDVIDTSLSPMGGRLMREWLLSPLRDVAEIQHRQRGVAEFVDAPFLRQDIREQLGHVLDIERLVSKIATGRANGRDMLALANSLAVVAPISDRMEEVYSSALGELRNRLDPMTELVDRVTTTLVDAPPQTLREGSLIREGISAELDELRQIAGDGKTWMARFQADEAKRTGITGLKIGYNSVFGYFLEVPRGQLDRVPETYIRKQTIKTSERYITPELKEFEGKVLQAEDRSKDLEYKLAIELRDALHAETARVLAVARALSEVDVLAGLAETAARERYVAPTVDTSDSLRIVDGRHPVIEATQDGVSFVPNDTKLDRSKRMVAVLTGPNMAGKSTYIRQTALIVLLAQVGSFVPAAEARIGVVDRIFTRIGAADDIGKGASTFMVEMVEIANILNNATARSLIVLDEVGRGTSTFDGLALAWAIVEYVHDKLRARTLFATHYHQLTDLAGRLKGVTNLSVSVREWEEEIVFLHKIVEGGTDRSYGIQVARLAGVPHELLVRAKEILIDIEEDAEDLAPRIAGQSQATVATPTGGLQLGLFDDSPTPLERELESIDIDATTPLEALLELKRLQELLKSKNS